MTAKNQARETAKRVYAEQRWGDYDEDEGLSEANLCLAAVKAGMADRLVVEDARPPEPLVERCTACGTYAPKAFASECGRPDCKYRPPEPVDDGPRQCMVCNGRTFAKIDGSEDYRCVECKSVYNLAHSAKPQPIDDGLDDIFSLWNPIRSEAIMEAAALRTELASRGLAVRPVVEPLSLERREAELKLLYNYHDNDSPQFTRNQMMVAIYHGHRLADADKLAEALEQIAERWQKATNAGIRDLCDYVDDDEQNKVACDIFARCLNHLNRILRDALGDERYYAACKRAFEKPLAKLREADHDA